MVMMVSGWVVCVVVTGYVGTFCCFGSDSVYAGSSLGKPRWV